MTFKYLALAALLSSCTHDDPRPSPEPAHPATFDETASRLISMADDGWIVSRTADGEPRQQGDSLIFTGIAMGVLDCDRGDIPERALLKMLAENHGVPYRHPTLRDDYSLDGLLGLWWGVEHRTLMCPEARARWAAVLPQHLKATAIPPYFDVMLRTVITHVMDADAPTIEERGKLGSEVAGWAIAVVSQRAAAYRLHLGFLTLSVVDAPHGQNIYCEAVREAKMPLLEQFCGRVGLEPWLKGFEYNRWEYQHQRAVWEQPDAQGLTTPALDLLVAYRMLYP